LGEEVATVGVGGLREDGEVGLRVLGGEEELDGDALHRHVDPGIKAIVTIQISEDEVSKACDIAASASLSVLDDPAEDGQPATQAELLEDAILSNEANGGLV
jgi:hypothetical protein